MSEIKLREPDDDLIPLLRSCTADELDNLVGYITRKGGVSCQLKTTKAFKEFFPDHTKYADEIAAEIQKFGGNTIFNIMRMGMGVPYREIVCNTADKLDAEYEKSDPIVAIEEQILLKVLEKSWEKMTADEKESLLKGIMADTQDMPGEFPTRLVQAAIVAGSGFVSYRLSLIIANAVGRMILKRGIGGIAGVAMARWVAVFAGAVGLGITALWTLFDMLGPAYRIIIPCVLHISMLRQLHELKGTGSPVGDSLSGKTGNKEILFRKYSL